MSEDISVKVGKIYVDSITLVHESECVIIYRADLKAKYATGYWYGENMIALSSDDDTLKDEQSDNDTIITFNKVSEDWHGFCEVTRYTARIIFFKEDKDEMVWWPK